MRLRHVHLPSSHPHYVPYSLASRVQEHIRRQHLDFKDQDSQPAPPPLPPPAPTLISFTPQPIFTLGRRQTAPLSAAETARLTAPLKLLPASEEEVPVRLAHSPRGGLTTYHGPGQAVLWPVLDLRPRHHRPQQHAGFTVRCYARLLEETTIAVLGSLFGIEGLTTGDPGVWVRSRSRSRAGRAHHQPPPPPPPREEADDEDGGVPFAKIAALGVHLRRHVSALGTALNVAMPGPEAAGDERVDPWARIVACGLEGKRVTSVAGELAGGVAEVDAKLVGRRGGRVGTAATSLVRQGGREGMVASAWAEEFARRVGLQGVDAVGVEEVVALMESLARRADVDEDAIREEEEYLSQVKMLVRGA
ncbi:hypothetical protein VTK56DRAFT_2937 [Thermocarpiscus australiensis]